MGWDDWDEDEPKPRRRRRGDDSFDVCDGGAAHSGAVTGVGVVSIVLSALFLLCGGAFGLCGVFCASAGVAARQQGNIFPPDMFETAGGVLLGWALLHLLLGVGLLMAGIVTLQRRNWGRVMSLILGAIVGVLGGAQIVFSIVVAMSEGGGLFGNADPEERVVQAVIGCFWGLLYVAYAIFVYTVLLSSHYRAEFD